MNYDIVIGGDLNDVMFMFIFRLKIIAEFDSFVLGFDLLMRSMKKSDLFSNIPESVVNNEEKIAKSFAKVMGNFGEMDEENPSSRT